MRRASAVAATALVVGLALGGCTLSETSDGGEPAPVPQGFQRFEGNGVSFAYPAGWRVGEGPGQAAATVVRISPPGSPPDAAGAGPLVGFGRFEVSTAAEPEESFDAHRNEETAVYARRLLGQDDVEVPGAAASRRYEFEYESQKGSTPMRKLDLVVVGADRRTLYNLIAQAPVGEADRLAPAIESFRLGD